MQVDAFPEWASIVVNREYWIACYMNCRGKEIFHFCMKHKYVFKNIYGS